MSDSHQSHNPNPSTGSLLDDLIESLRCLPGVGPKSAQRMAFHLLQRDRAAAMQLGETLQNAMQQIQRCSVCRTFAEDPVCRICSDTGRDTSQLCVVESPADVLAIEQSTAFNGRYFVLMGHLSPLDGIGPEELGLDSLQVLMSDADVKELTLATNPTVEGAATASYIKDVARQHGVKVMQIARGIPLGGELEFIDGSTLSVAFADRSEVT